MALKCTNAQRMRLKQRSTNRQTNQGLNLEQVLTLGSRQGQGGAETESKHRCMAM